MCSGFEQAEVSFNHRFCGVAGEEQGLVGSGHLAKLAKSEGWQLEAVLNNDIVGGNTTPGDTLQMKDRVRVFSEGVPIAATTQEQQRIRALGKENDSPSRELARAIADVGRTYFSGSAQQNRFGAFLVDRPDRYLRGGDHSSFNHEGFAAVRFTEWREDYNHQHKNVVQAASWFRRSRARRSDRSSWISTTSLRWRG